MEITIESLREGDREAQHQLGRHAFGHTRPFDADAPMFGPERTVAAYAGDRLIGTTLTIPCGQWFGGRPVPMGGLSYVVMATDQRGQGVARRMLRESLERMAERGEVISTLYPTTATLYRSVGYEIAGVWTRLKVPISELPTDLPADDVEPADWADTSLFRPGYDGLASATPGWMERSDGWWDFIARQRRPSDDTNRYVFVLRRDGDIVGHVSYIHARSEQALFDIEIDDIGARDVTALRSAFALLGAHGTVASEVTTTLPARLLEPIVVHPHRMEVAQRWPWMTRLVDVPGAIAARGWPVHVDTSVELAIHDTLLDANDGKFVLSVADGTASLERGGSGTVALAVTDLAALYTGWLSATELAWHGRLEGGTASDLAALDAAFHGPEPTLPDFF